MGKGVPLVRVGWWNSTLGLTLDTVSIIVTSYNGTNQSAITATKTIHGDVSTLNTSTVSAAQTIAQSINYYEANPEYNGGALPFGLYNGSDGNVIPGVSYAYPTPYVMITALEYTTFPANQTSRCATKAMGPEVPDGAIYSYIEISSTYYSPIPYDSVSGSFFAIDDQPVNTADFQSWLYSQSSLMSAYPELRTCYLPGEGNGPPSLKIPVTALTATATSTVLGTYTAKAPKPSITLRPAIAPQTSDYKAPTPTPPKKESDQAPVIPMNTPTPTAEPDQGTVSSIIPDLSGPLPLLPSPEDIQPSVTPVVPTVLPQTGPNGPSQNPALPQPSLTQAPPQVQNSEPSSPANPQTGNGQPPNPAVAVSQDVENQPGNSAPAVAVAPPISFAGAAVTPDASSNYNLPGIGNVSPGGSPITTNNVVYSLAPSAAAIVSNGQSVALTPILQPPQTAGVAANSPPAFTFAGSTYTADSSSNFIIGGQTLKPGAPAIVASGTPISLAASGGAVVIGSSTQKLAVPAPTQAAVPALSFAGSTYTPGPSSQYVIASQTLTPGGVITVSGTPISLGPSGSVAVVGSSTQQLFPIPTPAPVITFGGSSYTANGASDFIVAGQTLTPGSVLTISGTPISYASGGSVVVIGSSTQQLSPALTPAPIISFHGSAYTADSASDFVIEGQTLTPGGVITISGTPISYAPDTSAVIVGGITRTLLPTSSAAIITFNGNTYTANSASDYIIASQTLTPGGVLTISGTPISLAPGGTDVVIGSSTEDVGLGALIMGGFTETGGSQPTGNAGAAATTWAAPFTPFTGGASGRRGSGGGMWWLLWGMVGVVGSWMLCI